VAERLDRYLPREACRIIAGNYEMRCELAGSTVYTLRT